MALETVPESTIMESTTMSGAIGSSPICATSIPTRVFLSSTALMLEEPTSRPTIVFDPMPNMCPPFCSEVRFPNSSFARVYRVQEAFTAALIFLPLRVSDHRLLFHPLIQLRFLEAPAIAQLERW